MFPTCAKSVVNCSWNYNTHTGIDIMYITIKNNLSRTFKYVNNVIRMVVAVNFRCAIFWNDNEIESGNAINERVWRNLSNEEHIELLWL